MGLFDPASYSDPSLNYTPALTVLNNPFTSYQPQLSAQQQPTGPQNFASGMNSMASNPLLQMGLGILSQGYTRAPQSPFQAIGSGMLQGLQAANQNNMANKKLGIEQQTANQQGQNINSEAAYRQAMAQNATNQTSNAFALGQTHANQGQQTIDLQKNAQNYFQNVTNPNAIAEGWAKIGQGQQGLDQARSNTLFEHGIQAGNLANTTNMTNANIGHLASTTASQNLQNSLIQKKTDMQNYLNDYGALTELNQALTKGDTQAAGAWMQKYPDQVGMLAVAYPTAYEKLMDSNGWQQIPISSPFINGGKPTMVPSTVAGHIVGMESYAHAREYTADVAHPDVAKALGLPTNGSGQPLPPTKGQNGTQTNPPAPAPAAPNPAIQQRINQYRQSGQTDQAIADTMRSQGIDPTPYGLK
jgi:hypothetical protein